MPVASSSQLNRTPPPEDFTRLHTPEPEEPEQNTPWSAAQRPSESLSYRLNFSCIYLRQAWTHWLFAEELHEVLREECIPFHIRGVPASSPHARFDGVTAKTVPAAKQNIQVNPKEVIVSVSLKGRSTQISIHPSYLEPWDPIEGNKVVIVGYRWIGQVGKLVKLDQECCAVDLASSGEQSYFTKGDVVNVLEK